MPTRKTSPQFERAYARGMLRSAFLSLFWAVIGARKKRPGGFTFQELSKAIGSSKHEVSRWFNGDPNWTLNTVASIAHALDLDLVIQAKERSTGLVFTPSGIQSSAPILHKVKDTVVGGNRMQLKTLRGNIEGYRMVETSAATFKAAA